MKTHTHIQARAHTHTQTHSAFLFVPNLGGFNKSHSSFQALSLSGLLATASALGEFKPSDTHSGREGFFFFTRRCAYPLLTTLPPPIYKRPLGCGSHLSRRWTKEGEWFTLWMWSVKHKLLRNKSPSPSLSHLHVFPDFARKQDSAAATGTGSLLMQPWQPPRTNCRN